MRKKLAILLLFLNIFPVLLSACYDAREIDDEVYAISIGVDSGVNNKIRITIQYPTYKSEGGKASSDGKGGGKSGNEQSGSNVHTIEAPTIIEGIDMFGMAISRKVSLMHTKLLIFSEEFARKGVGGYMGGLERYRETRSTMAIVVVKGSAENFINENKTNIGESLSKSIELLLSQSRFSGFFPQVKFVDFYKAILSPYREAIAILGGVNEFNNFPDQQTGNPPLITGKGFEPGNLPRKGVAKRELAGMAVFDGDKMVGTLDSYETTYYLIAIGKYQSGRISIEDKKSPGDAIVFDLHNSRKPKVKAYFVNGKPVVDIMLAIESEIVAIQSRIDYERLAMQDEILDQIKEFLLKGINDTIEKTQKQYKADIFGFGEWIAGNFSTIEAWESYQWLKHYPEAKINVDVKLDLRRSGLIFTSSPLYSTSGKKGRPSK